MRVLCTQKSSLQTPLSLPLAEPVEWIQGFLREFLAMLQTQASMHRLSCTPRDQLQPLRRVQPMYYFVSARISIQLLNWCCFPMKKRLDFGVVTWCPRGGFRARRLPGKL